jgi:hypothetical protein
MREHSEILWNHGKKINQCWSLHQDVMTPHANPLLAIPLDEL